MAKKKIKYFRGSGVSGRAAALAANTLAVFTYRERAILFVGSALCAGLLLWLPGFAGFPPTKYFDGSVLAGGSSILTLILVAVAIIGCMIVGLAEASLIQDEASLFCCCIGLAALSIRAGTIRPVLQYASGPGVLIALALETMLLCAMVLIAWIGLRIVISRFRDQGSEEASALSPGELAEPTLQDRLTTVVMQVVVMALLELLLVQTDSKPQAMAGVCIAGFAGSLAAYQTTSVAEAIWYLLGPAIVGMVGYLLAFFTSSDGLGIGEVHGWCAALARPVPLDYASLGIAGALVGYWTSRRWAMPEPETTDEPPATESPTAEAT